MEPRKQPWVSLGQVCPWVSLNHLQWENERLSDGRKGDKRRGEKCRWPQWWYHCMALHETGLRLWCKVPSKHLPPWWVPTKQNQLSCPQLSFSGTVSHFCSLLKNGWSWSSPFLSYFAAAIAAHQSFAVCQSERKMMDLLQGEGKKIPQPINK